MKNIIVTIISIFVFSIFVKAQSSIIPFPKDENFSFDIPVLGATSNESSITADFIRVYYEPDTNNAILMLFYKDKFVNAYKFDNCIIEGCVDNDNLKMVVIRDENNNIKAATYICNTQGNWLLSIY